MKPESYAWQQLREYAAAQLRPGFARRVLRLTHGSEAEKAAWLRLQSQAGAQLRPGFAQRVMLAARAVAGPSFSSQFMLSAATASVCVLGVFLVHQRATSNEDALNLAGWQQLATADLREGDLNP